MDDEAVLNRVARALAGGEAIDWAAEEAAHPRLKPRLRLFQDVLAIAQAHQTPPTNDLAAPAPGARRLNAPGMATTVPEGQRASGPVPAHEGGLLFTWGTLEVRELIGRGGFGEVYRAYDPAVDREVALKLRRGDLRQSEADSERFLNEARKAARLRHPNVLVIYGAARHNGRVGLWTELLHGKTLEDLLKDLGRLGAHEATLIGIDLCRALAAVHAAGLVHRDVKTTNVIREQGGRFVLMDFGSVVSVMPDDDGPCAGRQSGTPLFMAPEVLRGGYPSPASDLYALGVVLFRLVSERFPIEATSLRDLAERHAQGIRLRLRDVRPDIPHPFLLCLERALDADPARRYASAGEMEQALVSTLGSTSALVPTDKKGETRSRQVAPFRSGEGIVVVDFEDRTGEADLGVSLRDACEEMLSHSSFLKVVRGEALQRAIESEGGVLGQRLDEKLAKRLCSRLKLVGFLSGSVEAGDEGMRLALELHRAGRATLVATRRAACPTREGLLALLREQVIDLRRFLGESPRSLGDPPPPTTRSLWAYRAYAISRRTFNGHEALALLREAIESDPEFAEAYRMASRSCTALGLSRQARRLAHAGLERAAWLPERYRLPFQIEAAKSAYDFDLQIDLLSREQRLCPHDQAPLRALGWLYLNVFQDPATAESYYRRLNDDREVESTSGNLVQCLLLQGKLGELDRLVEALRTRGLSGEVLGACELIACQARQDWEKFDQHASHLETLPGVVRVFVLSSKMDRWLSVGRMAEAERAAAVLWRSARESESFTGMYVADICRMWMASRRRTDVAPSQVGPFELARESLLLLPELAVLCIDLKEEARLEDVIVGHEEFERESKSRFVREELQFARASLALIRGDADRARALLEALSRNSTLVLRHRALGRAYEALGSWREAAIAYEEVVRFPNMRFWRYENPAVWVLDQFRLARAYQHVGDIPRARFWFERFLDDWNDADGDILEIAEAREYLRL